MRLLLAVTLAGFLVLAGCGDGEDESAPGGQGAGGGKDISAPIRALLAEMAKPDPAVRKEAVEALGELGTTAEPALPQLRRAMNDQDAQVRIAAAKAVAKIEAAVAAAKKAEPLGPDAVAGEYTVGKLADKDIAEVSWKTKIGTGILAPYNSQPANQARAKVREMFEGQVWALDEGGNLGLVVLLPAAFRDQFDDETAMPLAGPTKTEGNRRPFRLRYSSTGGLASLWLDGAVTRPADVPVVSAKLTVATPKNMLEAVVQVRLEPVVP